MTRPSASTKPSWIRFREAPESNRALITEVGEKPISETVRSRQETVSTRTIEEAGLDGGLRELASRCPETASFPKGLGSWSTRVLGHSKPLPDGWEHVPYRGGSLRFCVWVIRIGNKGYSLDDDSFRPSRLDREVREGCRNDRIAFALELSRN